MTSESKFVTSSSRFAPNCKPKNSLRKYYMNLHQQHHQKQKEDCYERAVLKLEMQRYQLQNMQRDM